jgi:hypothetical protein
MKTRASELKQVTDAGTLPDGQYVGVWGGYRVTFEFGGVWYEARTLDGIRTHNAPCRITIKNGEMSVETLP